MKKNKNIAWDRKPLSTLDLSNKHVAVIGGTDGLGRAISRAMAERGANVLVVGRTFRDEGVKGIRFVEADLGLMSEAKGIGKSLPAETLDLVLFTTGIFAAPKRQETTEGIERDMAVSYLSRLVIIRELAPRLGKGRRTISQGKPRVFVMGYPGAGQTGTLGDLNAEDSYSAIPVHLNTVAGNEMLVLDAVKRYPHVAFFGLNPGLIRTNIRDNFLGAGSLKSRFIESMIGFLKQNPESYAERIVPLLVAPELESHSGAMFNNKGDAIEASEGLSESHIRAFMAESEALVAQAGVSLRYSVPSPPQPHAN